MHCVPLYLRYAQLPPLPRSLDSRLHSRMWHSCVGRATQVAAVADVQPATACPLCGAGADAEANLPRCSARTKLHRKRGTL
eukprot:538271-Pleurochrysis_carterae.AAC.2